MGQLLSHRASATIGAVDFLYTLGHLKRRRITEQRIGTGHVHCAPGHLHTRPGDDAVFNSGFHIDIRVPSTFGFDIANGREPPLHHASGINRRVDGPKFRRLFEQLLVVVGRGDIPLQEHVGMRIDQARQTGQR